MTKAALWVGALRAASLMACSGIPVQPYQEPTAGVPSARVRVISNASVFGDSLAGRCAPALRHRMVEAGRFAGGVALPGHAPFPAVPAALGMPPRSATPLLSLKPTGRGGAGRIEEVVAEYRVPTAAPFQFATLGVGLGSALGRGLYCEAEARVYELEAGQDYEVVIGMGSMGAGDKARLGCRFDVRRLQPLGQGESGMQVGVPVAGRLAPTRLCD